MLASFASFLQVGVFLIVPTFVAWALWWKPGFSSALLALYALTYFDGAERDIRRKRTWPAFSRGFWLLRFMRGYFPQNVHLHPKFLASETASNDGTRQQYIFALHPHGCMSEFRLLLDGQLLDLLPVLGTRICWLAASVLFRLPVVRELCLWSGCVDASRKTAERMLDSGLSLGIIPGGEREQLLTTYGKEIVFIKSRLGFVRLALRFGVPLVPCFVFGCSDMYHTSKFLIDARMALVKACGVALPICFGPYGLPGAPFKQPIDIVIGEPLDFGKCPDPTDDQVAEAHAKYISALQHLFDSNKARFGLADRKLELH